MPTVSFTLGDPNPGAYQYPVVRSGHRVDLLGTLLQLGDLGSECSVVLEEKYLTERDGLNLLLRLRMEPGLALSRSHVFLRLAHGLEVHVRHNAKYAVLCSKGVTLLSEGESPTQAAIDSSEPLSAREQLSTLEALPLQAEALVRRHDLANEWGPHRLWRGYAALKDVDEEPTWSRDAYQTLRSQEYYAYLLALAALRSRGISPKATDDAAVVAYEAFLDGHTGRALNVLLLDDEIAKGWGEAVSALLERPGTLTVDTSLGGLDFDTERAAVRTTATSGAWDLVLCDLRTSAKDGQEVPGAAHLSGAKLIGAIKESQPQTAVVAFTASNKAWSAEDLRDLGADGYWVKESPEYGVDDVYSQQNAARLFTAVRDALKPRSEARPVWDLHAALSAERSKRSRRGSGYDERWASAMGRTTLDVTLRLNAVDERLRRAYGFLVMSRSRHERDQFAMQRYDLAVLTLWSAINEVVHLYFADPKEGNDSYKGPLDKAWDAEFAVLNPVTGVREPYWHLKKGAEVLSPKTVPADLVDAICPGSSRAPEGKRTPQWPWGRADTAKATWLLRLAGRSDLARRFDAREFDGRPGLRELRNKLEYEHGRYGDIHEATLNDVHALCEVWNVLLLPAQV